MAAAANYDLLVIGGGSGGIACARRSAMYGAKVGLVEYKQMGGTCVNKGCVPKKCTFFAASLNEALHDAPFYGFKSETEIPKIDFPAFKAKRDAYIHRLNGIYDRNLNNSGVTVHNGYAKFTGPKTVQVGDETLTGTHILIAVGGEPTMPNIPGVEHCISSDGFFDLEQLPGRVAVVGGGYIGVEMAGIMRSLGSEVTMFLRGQEVLPRFDPTISKTLTEEMRSIGVQMVTGSTVSAVSKDANGKLTLAVGEDCVTHEDFDCVLFAIGRHAHTANLGLETTGMNMNGTKIVVDDFQNTTIPNVYAIGDVTGQLDLTPVAIAAGRKLAARLFRGEADAKLDYTNVPTVVFSHPSPVGTCGMTEPQAVAKYGQENIKIYQSKFVNMYFAMLDRKPVSLMKLIVHIPTDKVLGLHIIGNGADEMLQGFGVAMKMGATKKDFDSCVAIHPTAAEEVVTMV